MSARPDALTHYTALAAQAAALTDRRPVAFVPYGGTTFECRLEVEEAADYQCGHVRESAVIVEVEINGQWFDAIDVLSACALDDLHAGLEQMRRAG
jgi:hypothetical protein